MMPSTRPHINLFLHLQKEHEIESKDLLNLLTNFKYSERILLHRVKYSSQNIVHFTGQVHYDVPKRVQSLFSKVEMASNIITLKYFNLCVDCLTFKVSTSMNPSLFSFRDIVILDRSQLSWSWNGYFSCELIEQQFSLCEQITNFVNFKKETLSTPLKDLHKLKAGYSDSIQVLAFAHASVLVHLLGNFTVPYSDEKCSWCLLDRVLKVDESNFDDRNNALRLENKFGSFRFVSCGTKGFESLKIAQFVSVFETNVWKWILAVAIVLINIMNLLRGSLCPINSLEKLTCLIKVILEQGDPFPARFIQSKPFRFAICGTLLGGIVLSNAFKSTNVYNIVLPKQRLAFSTIEELIQHGYSVYTKLNSATYLPEMFEGVSQSTEAVILEAGLNKLLEIYFKDGRQMFLGNMEINSYFSAIYDALDSLKPDDLNFMIYLSKNTGPNLGIYDIIQQPFNILHPLVQIGMLDSIKAYSLLDTINFRKKQYNFIEDDLRKCNNSAWLLPDYQAQQLTRMLYKSGKHSDVGVNAHFKPNLNIYFEGAMPTILLQRASTIPSSGLLEWWSNLINRTDLVRRKDTEPPVKPNMAGNIQTVFLILPVGIAIACIFLIIELHGLILRILKATLYVIISIPLGHLKRASYKNIRLFRNAVKKMF